MISLFASLYKSIRFWSLPLYRFTVLLEHMIQPRIALKESDWQLAQPLIRTMNNTKATRCGSIGSNRTRLSINASHRSPRSFRKGSIAREGKRRSNSVPNTQPLDLLHLGVYCIHNPYTSLCVWFSSQALGLSFPAGSFFSFIIERSNGSIIL